MSAPTKPTIQLTPQISVNGKTIAFAKQKQTLLECLEQANVAVHYHCRDGFCGACRVTLAAGEINYPKGDPLAFVGVNEILPCCCVPVTNISIKLDE